MTEQERMLSGQLYRSGEETLCAARLRAKELCRRFNDTAPADAAAREDILRRLLGAMGESVWIEPTFRCDYGSQITIGSFFFANYDCIFLDVAPITIGSHVMLGPRVCLYTAGPPTVAEVRDLELEFGRPITIADSVWIGGSAVVCPGVSIGAGSVIAAGAVVTRDIPAGVIAAGNPCRVLRPLTDADRARWESAHREYQAQQSQ
ncbi:sugar O-acetyltransferase [Dysosmobacter sp.]